MGQTCDDLEVDCFPAAVAHDVYVVPLFSWYNAQFDKTSRPNPNHGLDAGCVWPLDPMHELWTYMLKLNEVNCERSYRGTVITTSHFLPLVTLPFHNDGTSAQGMGCEDIEDQIMQVKAKAHVYGHAYKRAIEEHGRMLFINQFHGWYGTELGNLDQTPLCIYDGQQGGFVVKDSRADVAGTTN